MPDYIKKYDIGPAGATLVGVATFVLSSTILAFAAPWSYIPAVIFALAGLGIVFSAGEKLLRKPNLREVGIGLVGLGVFSFALGLFGWAIPMLDWSWLLIAGIILSIGAMAGRKLPFVGFLFGE